MFHLPGLGVSVEVVSAVVAARGGDVRVAFFPERADDEVADGGEGVGLISGPRLLRVLPECHSRT